VRCAAAAGAVAAGFYSVRSERQLMDAQSTLDQRLLQLLQQSVIAQQI
jgi:hypothetical protein